MSFTCPRARLVGLPAPRVARWRVTLAAAIFGTAAAAGRAHAEVAPPPGDGAAVRLQLAASGLPFSAAELESAVQARLPLVRDAAAATTVTVSPAPESGTIVVTSAHRLEAVTVEGKPPAEAARLVALAVLAVARPAAPETSAAGGAEERRDGGPPGLAAVADRGAPAAWQLGAATGISLGLAGARASFAPALELAWAPVARAPQWQIAAGVGFARAGATSRQGDFVLDTFPVRVGLRRHWGFVAATLGPVLRLYRTSGLAGGAGALPGGFAALGAARTLGGRVRATLTLACDLNPQQLVFRANGEPLLSVGPVIPWLGLGLTWGAS